MLSGQNPLADISSLLGSFSSGQKANRVVEGNFTQGYDRNMLAAQQDRNANESDALSKLAVTNNILNNPGLGAAPKPLSIGGKSYDMSGFGGAPAAPPSQEQKLGASNLQGQLTQRLAPGGSYTPQPLDSYAKPGTSEQIGNWGAVGSGLLGAIPGLASKLIPGLSGAGAGAGAAAGAGGAAAGGGLGGTIAGLMTNPWTIGIGAGLAAIPLLKKLFGGPSDTELSGRDVEGQFERGLGGFDPMMGAVGQGYASHGLSSQQAQADVKAMLDAEKQGGPAVQSIIARIMQNMGQGTR
jgi:hypothetical protein